MCDVRFPAQLSMMMVIISGRIEMEILCNCVFVFMSHTLIINISAHIRYTGEKMKTEARQIMTK